MRHSIILALALSVMLGAFAQGGSTTVQPLSSFTGSVADEGKMKDAVSPITDQVTLIALWKDWGIADQMPVVDFMQQLVVVSTSIGFDVHQVLTLDNTGNLTVKVTASPGQGSRPGFRYVISVINRAGITSISVINPEGDTSVNRVALPVPVTILRGASVGTGAFTNRQNRQFTTITDEKTWGVLWGDTAVPVAVDFTKEEALFVATGARGTDETNAAITCVTETAQRITATVEETSPNPDIQPPAVAYPCTLVVIPKSDKPVYYADSSVGGTVVPILATLSDLDSLQAEEETAVIKDVAAWKELYDKQMPAGTALPEVNFGVDMALVVYGGSAWGSISQVTHVISGWTISQVIEVNGKLQVKCDVKPFEGLSTAPTPHPWTAVIVPKSDLPVIFSFTKPVATQAYHAV